jgi:hypothetical protein
LNLTRLLCRYGIDQASGGIVEIPWEDVAAGQCGLEGSPPGNRTAASSESSERSADGLSTFSTLPDGVAGHVPDPDAPSGTLGLPPVVEEGQ